jgi:hypothetical protein
VALQQSRGVLELGGLQLLQDRDIASLHSILSTPEAQPIHTIKVN